MVILPEINVESCYHIEETCINVDGFKKIYNLALVTFILLNLGKRK